MNISNTGIPLSFCSLCHSRSEGDPDNEFTHDHCNHILDDILTMEDDSQISVNISPAYYKRGDDLYNSYQLCSGDIAAAFEHLALHLEGVVTHLRSIAGELKEANPNDLTLVADTHVIILDGPKKFILPLINKNMASLDPYVDSEAMI